MPQLDMPLPVYCNRRTGTRGTHLRNAFVEEAKPGSEAPITIFGSPGVKSWGTVTPDIGCRGVCERLHDGKIAAVRGHSLYLIDSGGGFAKWDGITGSKRVSISSNGPELMIVAEPRGYVLRDGTLSEVTDPDFTGYQSAYVTELDGFMLHAAHDSQVFFKSGLYAAREYSADEYDLKSTYGDKLVAVYGSGNRLFAIGSASIEPYYNSGGSPFPYSRDPNGAIDIGCAAPHSLAKTQDGFFFLGSDNHVYFMPTGGVLPIDITEKGEAVVDSIEGMGIRDDAHGFAAKLQGHTFYFLVFPSEGICWVFDSKTGLWHQRESYGKDVMDIAGCVQAWGRQVVFRRSTGEIGVLSRDIEGEWDNRLVSSWTYASVYAQDRLAAHHELSILVDTGYNTSHGATKQIMLEISDDGGETFRVGPEAILGKRGQYGQRVNHNRLGSSRNRVYRHSIENMGRAQVRAAQLKASGALV